jgi:hypothetical protein
MEMRGEVVHPLPQRRIVHSVDDAVDVGTGHRLAIAPTLGPLIEQLPHRPPLPETFAAIPVGELPRDGNESIEMDAAAMGKDAVHLNGECT